MPDQKSGVLPLHHDPECRSGVFVSSAVGSSSCSWFPVVVLRVELSATRLSAEFGQPALDYQLPTSLLLVGFRVARPEQQRAWRTARHAFAELTGVPPSTNVSLSSRDGRSRTCVSVLPKHVGSPLPYIPLLFFQSERPDLNRGHRRKALVDPGPRPGAMTRLRYVLFPSDPYRSRTGLPALKGRCPRTDRRTGHLGVDHVGAYFPRS